VSARARVLSRQEDKKVRKTIKRVFITSSSMKGGKRVVVYRYIIRVPVSITEAQSKYESPMRAPGLISVVPNNRHFKSPYSKGNNLLFDMEESPVLSPSRPLRRLFEGFS